jgi:signal transduction histidine kinase
MSFVAEAQNAEILYERKKKIDSLTSIIKSQSLSEREQTEIYNEYATIYLANDEVEKALGYALKSDSIDGGIINKCMSKILLSKTYLRLEDYDRALRYADEAMQQANILKSDNLYITTLNLLSDIYIAQQRYPEAEAEALKVWQRDSTSVNESRIAAANIALANIYMQNAGKAADFFTKNIELNNLYSEKSFHTTVSDLYIKYNLDKKEIRLLSMKRQRLLYMTICIAGIMFSTVGWIVFRLRMHKKHLQKQLLAAQVVLESENEERERAARYLQNSLVKTISEAIDELDGSTEYSQNVRKKLGELIDEVHCIVTGIRPDILNRLGIKTSLENYCNKFPVVRFQFSGSDKRLDGKMEDAIYYCARELVNNSVKHSGATAVDVRLIQDNACILLTVGDNGHGFDRESAAAGSGLKNIYHRIIAFKGFIDILSSPGRGTEATVRIYI